MELDVARYRATWSGVRHLRGGIRLIRVLGRDPLLRRWCGLNEVHWDLGRVGGGGGGVDRWCRRWLGWGGGNSDIQKRALSGHLQGSGGLSLVVVWATRFHYLDDVVEVILFLADDGPWDFSPSLGRCRAI